MYRITPTPDARYIAIDVGEHALCTSTHLDDIEELVSIGEVVILVEDIENAEVMLGVEIEVIDEE